MEAWTTGNQANLSYVAREQREALTAIYQSKEPWKLMTRANEVIQTIKTEIEELQAAARNEAIAAINSKLASIQAIPAYTKIPDTLRTQVESFFSLLTDKAKEDRFIGNLKAMKSDIDRAYDNSVKSINAWVEEQATKPAQPAAAGGGQSAPATPAHIIKPVVSKAKAMNVDFDKPVLETEEDVEQYLAALRTKMLSFIRDNKNIMLN